MKGKRKSSALSLFLFVVFIMSFLINTKDVISTQQCTSDSDCEPGWSCTGHTIDNDYCVETPSCGDGYCTGSETSTSCPQDCILCNNNCQPTNCIYGDFGKNSVGQCRPSCGAAAYQAGSTEFRCVGDATQCNVLYPQNTQPQTYECPLCCVKTGTSSELTFTPTPSNPVSVAVGEEKRFTVSGGTSPYTMPTACHGSYVICQLNPSKNDEIIVKGVAPKTDGLWLIVKDSSSPQKEKGFDVVVTAGGTQKYKCSGTSCVADANGPYTSSNCDNQCGGGTGICALPGSYNVPFTVNEPPTSTKDKVGRVMKCYPPDDSSMDAVVAGANSLGAGVSRHLKPDGTPRDDTIDISGGRIIDIIYCVNPDPNDRCSSAWQWLEVGAGGGGDCGQGPYFDKLEGYDYAKFMDCTHKTPKYLAGRVFSNYASPQLTSEVISKLRDAGLNPTQASGSKDVIDFNVEYEPGKKVGKVDVIRAVDDNSGVGAAWQWLPVTGPQPPEGPPHIDSVTNPVRVGEILTIDGQRLTPTVQYFDSARVMSTYVGSINDAATQVTVPVPSYFKPGQYTVRVYAAADRVSNEVPVTVTGGNQKCSPDGDACGYCAEDSQCLLDPLAATDKQCINSGQFSSDNYCDNGQWTTRTKLLALKLLKLKSADYVLFCDNKENSLNTLQYLTGSNQDASTTLSNFDPNNFCVLKNSNAIIGAVSLNKNLSINSGSISVFGVTNCDSAMAFNDNQYHPCGLNNVWYNKGLNSIIFSSTALSISSDQEQTSFIVNIIQSIIDSIKRLVVRPPYDESYLKGIQKFRQLYMSMQGGKSIMGSIDFSGQQYLNAVIKYQGFSDNICIFVDSYSRTKTDTSSGIICKQEGNNFYVLAQGSQFTRLNPDDIWQDLTSKLRIK
mgnify:CR=1 FL=1